jgi:hypothetical protein
MGIDPTAVARHRNFGRAAAEDHYRRFPHASFGLDGLLALMREAMAPVAADRGFGSVAIEPLACTAAASFLRRWRELSRVHAAPFDADGWQDWPPTEGSA